MRRLFGLLVLLTLAVGAAMLLQLSWGNITLWVPPYRIDFSLQAAVIGLFLALVATLMIARILSGFLELPARVQRYRRRRQQEVRLQALSQMILDYFEGRFARAIKQSNQLKDDLGLRQASAGTIAAANAITASAAHAMHDRPLRDNAIEELNRLAVGSSKDQLADQAAVAALLAAEFALDERKGQQALIALAPLTQKESRQVHTMRLALRANQQVGNWDEVLRIARLLMNRKAITPTVAIHYKQRVADAWIADGRHQEAIALIEQVLKNNWDSGLAMRYGRCEGVAKDQLTQLERWLKAHPQDPELHWALGRLCQRERLWGKARLHLETSLRVRPMVETHLALAEIAESLSENDTAALHWKAAARLV